MQQRAAPVGCERGGVVPPHRQRVSGDAADRRAQRFDGGACEARRAERDDMPEHLPELGRCAGDVASVHPHRPRASAMVDSGVRDGVFLPRLGDRHQPRPNRWIRQSSDHGPHVRAGGEMNMVGGERRFRVRWGHPLAGSGQDRPHADLIHALAGAHPRTPVAGPGGVRPRQQVLVGERLPADAVLDMHRLRGGLPAHRAHPRHGLGGEARPGGPVAQLPHHHRAGRIPSHDAARTRSSPQP